MATVETENRANLVEANAEYAASRPRKMGKLKRLPQKRYLIVTCMDARIDPVEAFGIDPGDAHIIRNAGGSARAALRDIILSHHLLGTKEVFIIKHRDCEVQQYFSNIDVLSHIYPGKIECAGAASIRDMQFDVFTCPHAATREDWWFLQNHPAVSDELVVHGFVYDPATGTLDDVEPQDGDPSAPPGSQPNPPAQAGPRPAAGRPRSPPRTPQQSAAKRVREGVAMAATAKAIDSLLGAKRGADALPRRRAVHGKRVGATYTRASPVAEEGGE